MKSDEVIIEKNIYGNIIKACKLRFTNIDRIKGYDKALIKMLTMFQ